MNRRRILRVEGDSIVVAHEEPFESEQFLHNAIANHASVLPSSELGLGTLATIACELGTTAGFIDMLAVDQYGKLAIVEFKKGSENPDSRSVVAQLLDYGASLWGMSYPELESKASQGAPGFGGSLAEHVSRSLGDPSEFDERAFRSGVEASMAAGSFVFFYVARDLEPRAIRIMKYITESARMTFAGVEVDHYRSEEHNAVLIPRLVFSPTWVDSGTEAEPSEPVSSRLERAIPAARQFKERIDEYATRNSLQTKQAKKSYVYSSGHGGKAWFYPDRSRIELDLQSVRDRGDGDLADAVLEAVGDLIGTTVRAKLYPSISCEALLNSWDSAESRILDPVFMPREAD